MNEFIAKIAASPWITIAAFAVGIIGIILTIFMYYKTRRNRRICYATRSFNLFGHRYSALCKLQVFYNQQPTENLTVTKLCFWNIGNESIKSDDIAPKDQLMISIKKEEKILDADIIGHNNKSNAFKLTRESDSAVGIKFDFIDPGDGVVLNIVHTSDSGNDVVVTGSIIGCGIPQRRKTFDLYGALFHGYAEGQKKLSRSQFKWMFLIFAIFVTIITVYPFISKNLLSESQSTLIVPPIESKIELCIGFILILPYWWITLRLFYPIVPGDLKRFEDDW